MALTSLRIPGVDDTPDQYIQVETIEGDNGIIVHVYKCNDKFEIGPDKDALADKRSEAEYHTALRKAAAEKGHLVTSHSTNPEWTPEDYVNNLNDGGEEE